MALELRRCGRHVAGSPIPLPSGETRVSAQLHPAFVPRPSRAASVHHEGHRIIRGQLMFGGNHSSLMPHAQRRLDSSAFMASAGAYDPDLRRATEGILAELAGGVRRVEDAASMTRSRLRAGRTLTVRFRSRICPARWQGTHPSRTCRQEKLLHVVQVTRENAARKRPTTIRRRNGFEPIWNPRAGGGLRRMWQRACQDQQSYIDPANFLSCAATQSPAGKKKFTTPGL